MAKIPRILQTIFLLIIFQTSNLFAETWQKLDGPYGGMVNALIRGKPGSKELFAGCSDGVRYSNDDGITWTVPEQNGLNKGIRCLAISPVNGTLWAGTGDGVFCSSDKGNNWKKMVNALPLDSYIKVHLVYAMCFASNGDLFVAIDFGVCVLRNGADTWIATGIKKHYFYNALAVDKEDTLYAAGQNIEVQMLKKNENEPVMLPVVGKMNRYLANGLSIDDAGNVYVAMSTNGYMNPAGVFVLTKGAMNWKHLGSNPTNATDVFTLGKELYASMSGDLYVSSDEGGTFRNMTEEMTTGSPENVFKQGDDIYFSSNTVYHSKDNGATWTSTSPFTNGLRIPLASGKSRALAVSGNGDVYVGAAGGVARSKDDGKTWEPLNEGLNGTGIDRMGVNKLGEVVVLATHPYRLKNNGKVWSSSTGVKVTHSGSDLLLDKDGNLCVGTAWEDVLWRSTDNGDTFTIASKIPIPPYCLGRGSDGTLYTADEKRGAGVYCTKDGINWTNLDPNSMVTDGNITSIAIKKNGEIFVSGGDVWHYDGGNKWSKRENGLPKRGLQGVVSFGLDAEENLYAGELGGQTSDHGLYKTTDSGLHWECVSKGLVPWKFADDGKGSLYALTGNGVYKLGKK